MAMREYDNVQHYRQLILKMWSEGKATFYHGLVPNLMGIIIYKGAGFLLYENIYVYNSSRFLKNHPYLNELFSAPLGAVCGQLAAYPFDVLKRNMMVSHQKMSINQAVKHIYHMNGGFLAFYKGFTINLMKIPIANAISFSSRRYLNSFLEKKK